MNYTRKDNGLNQYQSWSPSVINYDSDIGGTWGSPGHANGVMMQDGNITAGYNAMNQIMLATSGSLSPNWMFFGYDPLGRCVKRWTGALTPEGKVPAPESNPATYYYYDGWNLIQEGPASGGITSVGANLVPAGAGGASRIYIHGARVDEIVTSINLYNLQVVYHQYDALNNCSMLTSDTGNIVEQYEYDAFGWPYVYDGAGTYYASNSPVGNHFLFQGREWLSDLKLYDFRNRMYQPELGRFMQPDPKHFGAGDYNLYRYCHNDPVNKTDPTGLIPEGWEGYENRDDVAKGMLQGTAAAASVLGGYGAYQAAGRALFTLATRVPLVARLIGVGAAATTKELTSPKVGDPKLGNLVRDLYKGTQAANPVGNGSTADAVRHELATGQAVGGTFHSQKAEQYMRALGNWLQRSPDASQRDKMVAETLRRDLKDALRGR